jgi:hypothetical protein
MAMAQPQQTYPPKDAMNQQAFDIPPLEGHEYVASQTQPILLQTGHVLTGTLFSYDAPAGAPPGYASAPPAGAPGGLAPQEGAPGDKVVPLDRLRQEPQLIDCPNCKVKAPTKVQGRSKGKQQFMNVFWWPLPNRKTWSEKVHWYCSNCDIELAMQKDGKELQVLV